MGGVREHFLSTLEAPTVDVVESVLSGYSFLVLDSLATSAECESLSASASALAVTERAGGKTGGVDGENSRVRIDVQRGMEAKDNTLCDRILQRVIASLATQHPDLIVQLFGDHLDTDTTSGVLINDRVRFSTGEPAVNVYSAGGGFKPHMDQQSLTILVAISDAESGSFEGGGTAFWSVDDHGLGSHSSNNQQIQNEPTVVVHSAAGTALVFVGSVTHSGQPIITGERIVFVASFSPAHAERPDSDPRKRLAASRRQDPFLLARSERERAVESKQLIRRAMAMRLRNNQSRD